jgi:transposase
MGQLKLTSWQRRQLEHQLRLTGGARLFRRTLAVLEASRGRPVAEIADVLRTSRRSVYRWIDVYRQTRDPKALCEGEHTGRPSLWDEENEATLQCLMNHRPDESGYYAVNWTALLLREQMEHTSGHPFSQAMVREELHRLGYVWKRGRYELLADPELEKRKTYSPPNWQFAAGNSPAG